MFVFHTESKLVFLLFAWFYDWPLRIEFLFLDKNQTSSPTLSSHWLPMLHHLDVQPRERFFSSIFFGLFTFIVSGWSAPFLFWWGPFVQFPNTTLQLWPLLQNPNMDICNPEIEYFFLAISSDVFELAQIRMSQANFVSEAKYCRLINFMAVFSTSPVSRRLFEVKLYYLPL